MSPHFAGQCRNGLTCPYIHDSDKVAACSQWLKGNRCPFKASECPLSHVADPRRMPHCPYYPNCTRPVGTCPFPHVHLASTASVCADFGRLGWCEKGVACSERHVRECPEFSQNGTCSIKNCRLPHIIRRRAASEGADEDDEPAPILGRKRAAPEQPVGISTGSGAGLVDAKRRKLGPDDGSDFLAFDDEADWPAPAAHDDDESQSDVDSDQLDSTSGADSQADDAASAHDSADD